MGSPWPWNQEPVKSSSSHGSIAQIHQHNNNSGNNATNGHHHTNNKRASFEQLQNQQPLFYANGQQQTTFQEYHTQQNFTNFHQHHSPLPPPPQLNTNFYYNQQNNNGTRYDTVSSSPTPLITGGGESNGQFLPKRRLNNQQNAPTYFTFEGMQTPPPPRHHHQITSRMSNSSSATSSPTITTTGTPAPSTPSPLSPNAVKSPVPAVLHRRSSQFITYVKEIPTWQRYYSDQKHRLIDFTDKNNSIKADPFINQLVSLCFVDTCMTNLAVDAIVNSTTRDYSGSAGVDKLIHQQAGSSLRDACKVLPKLEPAHAQLTLGFALPAKYIIHTNGPTGEDNVEQLMGCYVSSFNLLLMNRLRTIAFPCISTGKKGLPKRLAADIALRTTRHFLEEHKNSVDRVIFCLHHQKDIEIYLRYMQIYFPIPDPLFIA